jgi:hypothetical protein
MPDFMKTLDINNICKGAVPERFERELAEVLKNIADPSTPVKAKRRITIELEFKPFPDRDGANVVLSLKTKLAAVDPQPGSVFFQRQGPMLKAYSHDTRQTDLFEPPAADDKPQTQ